MILSRLLLQVQPIVTDTVSAAKIQAMTDSVKARVDSLTYKLTNPDSIASLSPSKVAKGIKEFDWSGVITNLSSQLISFSLRLVAAIAIFYLGKFIINKIHGLARTVMLKKDFDHSLSSFVLSFIKVTLLFLLIITVIGVIGIETSSFIAIFASAGVAVGLALSGTLQNFAGGVLILLIKPFKVGDYIEFGQFKGFVKEIQIFHTILTTYNNDKIIIPNGGLSTGTINNFSAEEYRRLEWRVAISYGDNVTDARNAIMDIINNEERIIKKNTEKIEEETDTVKTQVPEKVNQKSLPWWKRLFKRKKDTSEYDDSVKKELPSKMPQRDYTPYVAVESMEDSSIVLITRAWSKTKDYWNSLPKHGLHFPFPQMDIHVKDKI